VRDGVQGLSAQWVTEGASGQVERVAARFALVGVAGELATEAGLSGWPAGESARAARDCFNAWLASRGGAGDGEVTAMLRQVRRFLEAHGEGRFTWWHRAADDHNAKTLQRAGIRRMIGADGTPIKKNSQHLTEFGDKMTAEDGEGVSTEYFILPEVFRAEVCQGFDAQTVANVLKEHECLRADDGRLMTRQRLPGFGLSWCYHITPDLFALPV
jgi:putative DNA primase/helicase